MDTPNVDLLEAHELLRKECKWYQESDKAGGPVGDPEDHCKPAEGKGSPPRLVAKLSGEVELTPRTAEASTVVQPTVPPGGPGLFHIKGEHLPPYVEHLYKHLVGRYGKHGAYRVAMGVVEKWKNGIAPGGKKGGKPRHTHADVRAAAAKNVAEWEASRAKAHARSREHKREHVKATVSLAAIASPASSGAPGEPFPGEAKIALPPVPANKVTKSMYTAHRINDTLLHLAHAAERLNQAKQGKAMRGYHMIHVNNHLSSGIREAHNLVANVRKNYPAESRELDALSKTIGLAVSVSPDAKVATFAHLLETVLYQLAHSKRHAVVMLNPDPDNVWKFNYDHLHSHLKGALEHAYKLAKHIDDNYPDEAHWLNDLAKIEDPNDPYMGLASGMTAPGAQPSAIPPVPGGSYEQYGLHQRPSQTVSPSPPLPPKVEAPAPAEVRALIGQVPDCADVSLSNTVRKFLEAAAVKLEKDDEMQALAALRSTGAAILAAHKADLGAVLPAFYTAGVFSRIPPAEQSSAGQAVLEGTRRREEWRKLEIAVQAMADRLRKRFFHGRYNGPSAMARLTAQPIPRATLRRLEDS